MLDTIASAILWIVTALIAAATFLPVTNLPHGAIQGLSFIRLQVFVATLVVAVLVALFMNGAPMWAAIAILGASAATNAIYVAKFTPLWRKQSIRPEPDFADLAASSVTILASNVKLSNRNYDRFIDMARKEAPDILVAVEVDDKWIAGVSVLRPDYAQHVDVPMPTGYGMFLWSKLPLEQVRVSDRVIEGVPSIRAAVQLRSGAWFRIYAIHPEPPVPDQDTKGRDSELALAGIEAREDPLPAIVTGDLNDVAWSSTTRRFQRLSGLLDPRVGRGFYTTFNAFYPFFRWPLDHLFHDPKFRLVDMRRLPHIESDHFPIIFTLALAVGAGESDLPEDASEDEEADVAEMIAKEQATARQPIGTDWEKG